MIQQCDIADLIADRPIGKRVPSVLQTLRSLGETPISNFKVTGNLLPSERFRRIYEDRVSCLAKTGADIEPTVVDAIADLSEWSDRVYLVAFARGSRHHFVLFLSPEDEVVAGFVYVSASRRPDAE